MTKKEERDLSGTKLNQTEQTKGFEFRDHTADVQVRSWGSSLEEAFSQTALSLMATITPNLEKITPKVEREMTVEAEDIEALLFDFLSEFLYIFDVEELIFNQIYVHQIERLNSDHLRNMPSSNSGIFEDVQYDFEILVYILDLFEPNASQVILFRPIQNIYSIETNYE